jgi:hypothetical protein
MKPIRTYRELAALCDARKARRTDPTPEQVARATKNWFAPPFLTRWLAGEKRA